MRLSNTMSFAQWGIDKFGKDFLEKYWNYELNDISPWEISYSTNRCNKILIKCQHKDYHGSYDVSPNNFTSKDSRCPYCNGKKVHVLDSLGMQYPQILELWSDRNKKSPYEYTVSSALEVWWKCLDKKHTDYKRSILGSKTYDFRCPTCIRQRNESFLQEKVRLYLNEFNYEILHENNCTITPINPKTKHPLHYDNEIIINNNHCIIEVNGLQHYEICGFHLLQSKLNNILPEDVLHYQKLKDRYKRMYAKSHGYHYLELPYWTDDENKTWKLLIDNKLAEFN